MNLCRSPLTETNSIPRKLPIGNSTGYFTRYIEIVREICNSTANRAITYTNNTKFDVIYFYCLLKHLRYDVLNNCDI